jgi:hypothetical protein
MTVLNSWQASLVGGYAGSAENRRKFQKQEQIVAQYSTMSAILYIALGGLRGARKLGTKGADISWGGRFSSGWGRSYNNKTQQYTE